MQVSRPLPVPPQRQLANMNPSQLSPLMDRTYSNLSQPSLVREKGYNSHQSDTSLMPLQVSRPLPVPPQQQLANINPSQPSPVMDKTYSNSSQLFPVREKGHNSQLSDTSLMPLQMQASCPLPVPLQQQLANMNPSQPSSVMDKTYLNSSQPPPVRQKGYNSQLSDTCLMPPQSYPPLPKYEVEQSFNNNISKLSPRNSPTSLSLALYPASVALYSRPQQQPCTPSFPAHSYNCNHPDFKGPHEEEQQQHVYPPRPHFQRPNEQQHQHVYLPGPSLSDTHYTTPISIPQTISPAEPSSLVSYSHATYLSTALPLVPQRRLHEDDSVKPLSSLLPLSVPVSTSSVPQNPQGKEKDSTSPTARLIYPSGCSPAKFKKAKPKPRTTDPSPTQFKGLRLFKDKIKKTLWKRRVSSQGQGDLVICKETEKLEIYSSKEK